MMATKTMTSTCVTVSVLLVDVDLLDEMDEFGYSGSDQVVEDEEELDQLAEDALGAEDGENVDWGGGASQILVVSQCIVFWHGLATLRETTPMAMPCKALQDGVVGCIDLDSAGRVVGTLHGIARFYLFC